MWLKVFRHIDRHVNVAQPDIPLLFLPKSCPLEMSGRTSERATKGLHQYKPGFIRLTRSCANAPAKIQHLIPCSAEEAAQMMGGKWRKTSVKIQVLIVGCEVRREKDLRMLVRPLGEDTPWQDKQDCEVGSVGREKVMLHIRQQRAADQIGGYIWEDGVRADEMLLESEVKAEQAGEQRGDEDEDADEDAEGCSITASRSADTSAATADTSATTADTSLDAPPAASTSRSLPAPSASRSTTSSLQRSGDGHPPPLHPCVVPGSVWETVGGGHCGWHAASRAMGYDDEHLLFRDDVYESLDPNEPQQAALRRQIYPGGVRPTGRAREIFTKACDEELWMNSKMLEYLNIYCEASIAVINASDPAQSYTLEWPGATETVGMVFYPEEKHWRGCEVHDDPALLPPRPPHLL